MAPASTRPRIAGARKAVIQSRPAGLMVSLRRASVIMPRSPTSTTRSSAKRPLILLTWLSSVEGSADIALEDLDRHRASLGGAKKPKHDLQLAFAVAIVTELRQWAGAALKVGSRDVVEHQRAVLQVAAGQRVLDALLLIDEPIEGLIKFLLIDRCEAQHRAERTVRRLRIEQARRRQLGYWIKQPCDDHGDGQRHFACWSPTTLRQHAIELELAQCAQCRRHVPVRQAAQQGQLLFARREIAAQHTSQRFDLRERPMRDVGKRALLDLLPLTIGLSQQVCGRRAAIGNAIHVHDSRESCFAAPCQAQNAQLHGYKLGLLPPTGFIINDLRNFCGVTSGDRKSTRLN